MTEPDLAKLKTNLMYAGDSLNEDLLEAHSDGGIQAIYEPVMDDTNGNAGLIARRTSLRLHFNGLEAWAEFAVLFPDKGAILNQDFQGKIGYDGRNESGKYLDGLLDRAMDSTRALGFRERTPTLFLNPQVTVGDFTDPKEAVVLTEGLSIVRYDCFRANLILTVEPLDSDDERLPGMKESVQSVYETATNHANRWRAFSDN